MKSGSFKLSEGLAMFSAKVNNARIKTAMSKGFYREGLIAWRRLGPRFIMGGIVVWLGLVSCTSPSSVADSTSVATDKPSSVPAEEVTEDGLLGQTQGQMLPITATVELGGETIALEVAATIDQQSMGLMYRDRVPPEQGMLFPFAPPRPVSFWMKNVAIPLDMVFVYRGQIVAIAADVPPCTADPCPTYGPGRQVVESVIELAGGRAAELGLQVGDPVTIEWLEPPGNMAK